MVNLKSLLIPVVLSGALATSYVNADTGGRGYAQRQTPVSSSELLELKNELREKDNELRKFMYIGFPLSLFTGLAIGYAIGRRKG